MYCLLFGFVFIVYFRIKSNRCGAGALYRVGIGWKELYIIVTANAVAVYQFYVIFVGLMQYYQQDTSKNLLTLNVIDLCLMVIKIFNL